MKKDDPNKYLKEESLIGRELLDLLVKMNVNLADIIQYCSVLTKTKKLENTTLSSRQRNPLL